eukprot:m.1595633 g.1595633  ORF g.1595633 m.1595633 type:complete len:371 (-) comp25342_c0_seq39:7209-8321(-)
MQVTKSKSGLTMTWHGSGSPKTGALPESADTRAHDVGGVERVRSQVQHRCPQRLRRGEREPDDGRRVHAPGAGNGDFGLKREILDDDLARELYAAETRLMAGQHQDAFAVIQKWSDEKLEYLKAREAEIKNYEGNHYLDVQTVGEAKLQLTLLDTFEKDKAAMTSANVASMKKLGQDVLARKYETKHSTYVYEKPEEIQANEQAVDTAWSELETESALKRPILDDHLARNEFQEKVRLWVKSHESIHQNITKWYNDKEAYLKVKETINSSDDARFQLATLAAFEKNKTDLTAAQVVPMQSLGADVREAKHSSAHSTCAHHRNCSLRCGCALLVQARSSDPTATDCAGGGLALRVPCACCDHVGYNSLEHV